MRVLLTLLVGLKNLKEKHLADTKQIKLRSTQLAAVTGPHGTLVLVLFNPTNKTIRDAMKWHTSEEKKSVLSIDRAGEYEDTAPRYATKCVYDNRTMIITTHS